MNFLFQELEMEPSCDLKMLRKQYLKLSVKYHPDKNSNTEEKFKKMKNAYEELVRIINDYNKNGERERQEMEKRERKEREERERKKEEREEREKEEIEILFDEFINHLLKKNKINSFKDEIVNNSYLSNNIFFNNYN